MNLHFKQTIYARHDLHTNDKYVCIYHIKKCQSSEVKHNKKYKFI